MRALAPSGSVAENRVVQNLFRKLAPAALPGLLLGLSLGSCQSVTPPGVHFSTTPPGARILVDGRDSGFVTPTNLHLDDDHWVQLELEGYESADVYLQSGTRRQTIPWTRGKVNVMTPWFPLFLPLEDLLLPVKVDKSPSPRRIYVKLRLSVEQ